MTGYGSFSYTLDAMGRRTGLTETGPGTVWVQNVGYGPSGEMRSLQYRTSGGAYYTETNAFNNRNQVVDTSVSGTGLAGAHYQYGYAAGANNGQITAMTDVVTGEQVVYTYDSLKRLAKAETVGGPLWGQSFGYDGFGNLVSKTPTAGHTGTTMALAVDGATNHVATAGFSYDANGNMTGIPAVPTNLAPVYDIENRTGGGWYDQQNQPLDRAGVWNLYGLRGERLETHTYAKTLHYTTVVVGGVPYSVPYYTWVDTLVTRNVYFGSRLIQSNGQTVLTDRLGTVRANEAGDRASYYPYGEQQGGGMGDGREKFATYTREVAGGLDYAGQRYYASGYGRFTSPDPSLDSNALALPVNWNRYAYVGGDPVGKNDPRGLCSPQDDPPCCSATGTAYAQSSAQSAGQLAFGNEGGSAAADQSTEHETGVGSVLSTIGACASDELGLTDALAAVGFALGQPVLAASGKFSGATAGTSPLSYALSQLLPWTLPFSVPAPTYSVLRLSLAMSNKVGRIVGRWIPVVGGAILVWDAVRIAGCTIDGLGNPTGGQTAISTQISVTNQTANGDRGGKVRITDPLRRPIATIGGIL